MGPRRCEGICEQRKDEFYSFEKQGESLMERHARVHEEWEVERKRREAERLKKESTASAFTKGSEESKAHLLLKNLAEGDNRGGKRMKEESVAELGIEANGEDAGVQIEMEMEYDCLEETDSE
jgi:hypothetical protein